MNFRRLLLRNRPRLDVASRGAVQTWLAQHPALQELYEYKEALHSLYRIRGADRAAAALTALTDRIATSSLPEIRTLRSTLIRWRREVLAYFVISASTLVILSLVTGWTNSLVKHHVAPHRRLYLDEDTWLALYSDSWDQQGRLWKFAQATTYLMPDVPALIPSYLVQTP